MIQEDLSLFSAEIVYEHPATVIGTIPGAVVLADDDDALFLYPMEDPSLLEVGTTVDVVRDGLMRPEEADAAMQKALAAFLSR